MARQFSVHRFVKVLQYTSYLISALFVLLAIIQFTQLSYVFSNSPLKICQERLSDYSNDLKLFDGCLQNIPGEDSSIWSMIVFGLIMAIIVPLAFHLLVFLLKYVFPKKKD